MISVAAKYVIRGGDFFTEIFIDVIVRSVVLHFQNINMQAPLAV
jgi:hypothetical protein